MVKINYVLVLRPAALSPNNRQNPQVSYNRSNTTALLLYNFMVEGLLSI
jgi:hypothetical protein